MYKELDVLSYQVTVEPEVQQKYVKGTEKITMRIDTDVDSIELACGKLVIDEVKGTHVISFRKEGSRLIVLLSANKERQIEITIKYHGNPVVGLLFNTDLDQAYTVYATSQWMICNDDPSDKATLDLNILLPKGKKCVASGDLIGMEENEHKMLFQWSQDYESPSYTYGFAFGDFREESEIQSGVKLKYYAQKFSDDKLKEVFKETGRMLEFFEEKSGVRYMQNTYSQVLIGSHFQEMSGFSVLKNSYGRMVLEDSTETNLISHELAHQWWGNQITCESWKHFWLNEAFATYMSAAYNEYRFGSEKYNADIASYFGVYQGIIKRGNDKSLVFDDWSNPSRDDRNLVYFKGAYVLHMLREDLGDEAFWNGVKYYSRRYFGESVATRDFQKSMEASSNRDLELFFRKWVYNKVK